MNEAEPRIEPGRDDRIIAYLAALAVVIHLLEAAVPSPLPGIKPGLANALVVVALRVFGLHIALWVGGLRVLGGSLLTGTFLTPTFFLSLAGAIASLAALALIHRLVGRWLSAWGLSVIAAQAHVAGQLAVAYLVLIPVPGLWHLLPWLLLFAIVLGSVSGWIAEAVIRRLESQCPHLVTLQAMPRESPR